MIEGDVYGHVILEPMPARPRGAVGFIGRTKTVLATPFAIEERHVAWFTIPC